MPINLLTFMCRNFWWLHYYFPIHGKTAHFGILKISRAKQKIYELKSLKIKFQKKKKQSD